ncbi:MAG: HNH endonuclease [Chloroflexi bacterium]|nr:HNH endonuclease [Chloroflexota bacterium]
MTSVYIPLALRHLVRAQAAARCEYCLIRETDVLLPHQPDHIIAEQHGGETTPDNLALACIHCNRYKGANIASLDPDTGWLTPLFNPRTQSWDDHFVLIGLRIEPLTAVGRVTVRLLRLNDPQRLRVRQALIETGTYP